MIPLCDICLSVVWVCCLLPYEFPYLCFDFVFLSLCLLVPPSCPIRCHLPVTGNQHIGLPSSHFVSTLHDRQSPPDHCAIYGLLMCHASSSYKRVSTCLACLLVCLPACQLYLAPSLPVFRPAHFLRFLSAKPLPDLLPFSLKLHHQCLSAVE